MVESYCINIYSTDPIGSSFVGFWIYKSKENCLILRTEGIKIRTQNKRPELFIQDG